MRQSPLEQYKERINSGELEQDPIQAQVMEALQNLYESILVTKAPKSKNIIKRAVSFIKKNPLPQGIYLYGGVGRGKSMMMDLFYDCLPKEIPSRRVHFHEFMIEYHSDMHRQQKEGLALDKALPAFASATAKQAQILCFDEFHVTDIADAMILGRLFTALWDSGVIMVATSNREPDDLYKGGLQRDKFLPFIAHLKEKMNVFHLDSPIDYRRQFLVEDGTYFHPLNKAASDSLDLLFQKLTDNASTQAEEVEVKGRAIPVTRTAKGCARFSFSELCERPHGAEDYIAIATRYHTVFIEGIPILKYDRRNEAKRLMTLIDILYENGTNLAISAEAPPDKLYSGTDHAFEFDRTISRLLEMQSAAYLGHSKH